MREMKFRAWDRVEKKMIPDIFDEFYTDAQEFFGSPRYIVLQYTGLKDKNGKEIYKGDILRITAVEDCNDYINDEKFVMERYCRDIVYLRNLTACDNFVELKTIGNIYENPELIK